MVLLSRETPSPALVLGFAGLVPFVMLALVANMESGTPRIETINIFFSYGACVLSFLGGLHWGLALADQLAPHERWVRMSYSAVPPLLGWLSLLAPWMQGLAILAVAFLLQYRMDRRLAQQADHLYPEWFLPLRLMLTVVVLLCMLAIARVL